MRIFTLEHQTNHITVHATAQEAEAVANADRFRNQAGLAKLAAEWPSARLIEIWNSIPGMKAVSKFKDRKTAVARIWKAIQSFGEPMAAEAALAPADEAITPQSAAAPEATPVAMEPETIPVVAAEAARETSFAPESTSEPEAVVTDVAPQTPHVASPETPAKNKATRVKQSPQPATNAHAPREGSKTSQVIAMLRRQGGTTLEEIMTAMGWQKHTTRALLSAGGALTRNHGLVIASEKVGDQRKYSLKA